MEEQNKIKKRKTASEILADNGYEGTVIFDNPTYDDALVGVSEDGRAIYSMDLMVEWLVREEEMSEEDAIEFIEYNTIRSLPYFKDAPIVLYHLYDEYEYEIKGEE